MLLRSAVVLALFALALAACDSAPGIPDPPGRAPLLDGLTVTPDALERAALGADQIDGDTARVPVTIEVDVAGDDVTDVQALVTRAKPGLRLLATVPLAPLGGTRYGVTFTLPLPIDEPGTYTVVVNARDASGAIGQVLGRVTYTAPNDPPVVERVAASPNPFPATGGTLTLTATVSDPQGLEDVLRVEVETPDGQAFRLFDDGESFGDQTANDGIFTASFALAVDAGTTGDIDFVFRAIDRAGLRSGDVTLTLTVQ